MSDKWEDILAEISQERARYPDKIPPEPEDWREQLLTDIWAVPYMLIVWAPAPAIITVAVAWGLLTGPAYRMLKGRRQ